MNNPLSTNIAKIYEIYKEKNTYRLMLYSIKSVSLLLSEKLDR